MDYGLFAASYSMFHATHGIADYWLQTNYQAQNKSKNIWALSRHILVYTLCFIPALILLGVTGWNLPLALLLIGLPHMAMDNRKFLNWFITKTKGWNQETYQKANPVLVSTITHVVIEMDQKYHYFCLALLSLLIAM